VLTPHRFAPLNKWAIRTISNSELLLALDFTETIANPAQQRGLLAVARDIVPGKILHSAFLIIQRAMTF
jgi:hypothetical protein